LEMESGRKIRFSNRQDYEKERGRVLTMKYGKQQMMLIRKRLRVEMWLLENLEPLCDLEKFDEAMIELDFLLDMEDEAQRRKWLQEQLQLHCSDKEKAEAFIEELLEKLKTL
ncbi:Protein phosphatase 1 regulatory subunit 14B, partial [Trichinella sp. T9]